MKTALQFMVFLTGVYLNSNAQDSTNKASIIVPQMASTISAPARKATVKLDRSASALGISAATQARLKSKINPPINIALFAIDSRMEATAGNSDVVMLISLDQQNGKVKMASIMRDTYVKIEGKGMDKLNSAFALGGPQLAIKTLNQNFDLDIKDYLNVDFYGAAKIVDALGGVTVNIKPAELSYLNTYLDELAIYDKTPAVHLVNSGLQQLNGKQTVAYSRIRGVGRGDYERTERQRTILLSIFNKLKGSGQEFFPVFATEVLPNMETSMTSFTLLNFAGSILNSKSKTIEQARFPLDKESVGKRIDDIWYLTTDLKVTTNSIHRFIYNQVSQKQK